MTTRLLHVVCTPRGLASNTARVSSALLEAMLEQDEDLTITTLDLFKADLPAVAGRNIESKYMLMTGQALDETAQTSWRQIEKTIEQFLDHDVYLLTVPMWNFGIPYALKYYIDAIVQPGYLFRYTPDGQVEGLVRDKTMVIVISSGSDYGADSMASYNFVESYLRAIFLQARQHFTEPSREASSLVERCLGYIHENYARDFDIDDLAAAARTLSDERALSGASDHGVSKSLYGADPDGNEFEIMWRVPRDAWGEHEEHGSILPLDIDAEVDRWGTKA